MDNLTHTMAGVALGNAFFRDRRPGSVTVLALASNLPDLDGAVMLTGDPASVLLRRTFGHSLLLLPLWCAALAWVLGRFHPRLSFRERLALCALGAGGHLFLDLVNSFGVVLLWPFSDWRPELAWVFIIDLALTSLLAAPLLLCRLEVFKSSRQAVWRTSLACAAAYLLLCASSRSSASAALRRAAPGPSEAAYVFPEPLGPHRWRGVVLKDGAWGLHLLRPWRGDSQDRGRVPTRRGDPAVEAARAHPLARRLELFFKAPVWDSQPCAEGSCRLVSVRDLRFSPLVIRRAGAFRFLFKVGKDGRVEPS